MSRFVSPTGIVSGTPTLRTFSNPVPMIQEQYAQLTRLLDEYAADMQRIENDTNLSDIGKREKLTPLTEKFQQRLEAMKTGHAFRVHGIEEARKALAVERPTSGNEVIDYLRAREIRDMLATMDKGDRISTLINSTNPEILYAVLDSPVPLVDVPRNDVEVALARMGEASAPEAALRLNDLTVIQDTLEVNWQAAESFIKQSVVV